MKHCQQHRSHLLRLILAAVVVCGWATMGMARETPPPSQVFVIPVAGDIEPSMAAFLHRALSSIPDKSDTLIVLEMDTFGGRLDTAFEMVDDLSAVRKANTVAFVTNKAISAGALVSLACRELMMMPNTTIGDCAPIIYSNEGPQVMGEKVQSPLRAKFRALAKANNYPVVLAEAMVTADMTVYEIVLDNQKTFMDGQAYQDLSEEKKAAISSKKTIVAKGELLTMDNNEAHELGFSRQSVDGLEKLLVYFGAEQAPVTRIQPNWSEKLVGVVGKISLILIIIGLGGLYLEIKSPGFGLPGIIGIAALALVFFSQYLAGLANFSELLVIALGVVLLGFEIFVLPGFGIAGIAGIIFIMIGLLLSLQNFIIPDPRLPWQRAIFIHNLAEVLGAAIGSFVLALFTLRFIFPRLSKAMHGPYLAATLSSARVGLPATAAAIRAGMTGTALTTLRPSGKAKIAGDVYDVVTRGDWLPKGTAIIVGRVKGSTIIVQGTGTENE